MVHDTLRHKPLSQWDVSSGDLELTRCKSTVKAICVGLAKSANYPDQWSDATFIRCKLHCERGAFSFAVRWRSVCCSLARFPKRPSLSFLDSLWMSIERAFKFKSLYFDFVYISSELFLFPDLRQWRVGQITDVLVLPPRDYQLRHLAVIPLRLCLVRQRPDYLITVKAISYRAVTFLSLEWIKLTRNNHCERGYRLIVVPQWETFKPRFRS